MGFLSLLPWGGAGGGLLFILFLSILSFSQTSDIGVTIGTSYYVGDLNPSGHFIFLRPAGGIIYRYNFNPRYSFKGNIIYGELFADDAQAKQDYQIKRNLSFISPLMEVSGQIEFNFFPFVSGDPDKYLYSPYIFAGISNFTINPKAEYNGKFYELHSLSTEGQGLTAYPDKKLYSLSQVSFPFGAGIKFNIIKNFSFAVEWGLRKSFTDYIDDVSTVYVDPEDIRAEKGPVAAALSDRSVSDQNTESNIGKQRGNSATKDWYSYTGLIITYNIGARKYECPAYKKNIIHKEGKKSQRFFKGKKERTKGHKPKKVKVSD